MQATAGPGDEVIYAWRSFEAYPIIVQISGAQAVRVPLTSTEEHDLPAMSAAVTERTRLVFVCTPNNPTGTVARRDELERFLDEVPSHVVVVLDEAYREFVRDPLAADGLDLYRERLNVVVLRTFSKAYGLAGARVGLGIAHRPVADALRKCQVLFGVSSLAQAAAIASLQAEDELLGRVEEREGTLAGLGHPARTGLEPPVVGGELRLAAPGRGNPGVRGRLRGERPRRAAVSRRGLPHHHCRGRSQRSAGAGRRRVPRVAGVGRAARVSLPVVEHAVHTGEFPGRREHPAPGW